MSAPIRTAQLVSPFGPGALYTNTAGHVVLIAGLDHWFQRRNSETSKLEAIEGVEEFLIEEPRLSRLLGGTGFRRAPDYRRPMRGTQPPPNANITVPAVRFPTWYRNQKDDRLIRVGAALVGHVGGKGEHWVPVRFATACEHGHLNEFPWKEWAQCSCADSSGLRLKDGGGTGLESIRVLCKECPTGSPGRSGRSLQGLTRLPDDDMPSGLGNAGLLCGGNRPWLGDTRESCGSPRVVAVLLSQSNLYSAQTASSLKLPDPGTLTDDVQKVIEFIRSRKKFEKVARRWQMGRTSEAEEMVKDDLAEADLSFNNVEQSVANALAVCCGGVRAASAGSIPPKNPEGEEVAFRREEFEVLRRETSADHDVCLRVVPSEVPEGLQPYIAELNRIEELTEVRALCGFNRIKDDRDHPISAVAEKAAHQFFRTPPASPEERWLPAIQVRGEGLFIRLSEDGFQEWLERNKTALRRRLPDNFVSRMVGESRLMAPSINADWRWAARFLLVHSFSHVLINQLVFECGYSTAALRERLYVSPDPASPMMATLIYTAQGDSEGTLGGLVNLGHADRFEAVVRRALSKAFWCSADPVCSESHGAGGARRLNLAACHSCALLPETACETINDGIDRGVVVGTADDRSIGFFRHLVEAPLHGTQAPVDA